jgi:ABC-type branched-subunit amino acid transport system substrate-binding protein
MCQGVLLWAEQVNDRGGIITQDGVQSTYVELIGYDDGSNTTTTTILYQQLIVEDECTYLIGK